MPFGKLHRVSIFIPLVEPVSFIFADGLISRFKREFNGATHSRIPEEQDEHSPFVGHFLSENTRQRVSYEEEVLWITVDIDLQDNHVNEDFKAQRMTLNTTEDLLRYLGSLKSLSENTLSQDLVWITVQEIKRVA